MMKYNYNNANDININQFCISKDNIYNTEKAISVIKK